ncbi:hypothetical protein PVAG01_08971 [Phlyctema vagabunda]|uniref:Ubiquitin 3 binding protein But2 C-terminal domain-containing protein n=1 Tax=Phlyctema vagabunda TaxID=108571 RepID=A0ABR4PBD8_9HELO
MKLFVCVSVLLHGILAIPLEVVSLEPLANLNQRTIRSNDEERYQDQIQSQEQCSIGGTLPNEGVLEPILTIPISATQPSRSFGATKEGPLVTPNDICTIFNVEMPRAAYSQTCTLKFLLPYPQQSDDDYGFAGDGHFTFTGYALDSGAAGDTTFLTQPPAGPSPSHPPAVLQPGNAYTISSGRCADPELFGDREKITLAVKLCSSDTYLKFEQDQRACPVGFYVVVS